MYQPKVSVIVPCKEFSHDLRSNLQSIVDQQGTNIDYVFVLADYDDAARYTIQRVMWDNPGRQIELIIAGKSKTCSEKNYNVIHGIRQSHETTETFVVLDSDGYYHPTFVKQLIEPLINTTVGATTGYRWYEPKNWYSLPSVMRCVWNAGAYAYIDDPKTSFVWGGAMAVRAKTYHAHDLGGYCEHRIDEDHVISTVLKNVGYRLEFVRECIAISKADDTWASLLNWTNRSTIITKLYNKPFWFSSGWLPVLTHLWMLVNLVGYLTLGIAWWVALIPVLGWLLGSMWVAEALAGYGRLLSKRPINTFMFVWVSPLVSTLYCFNVLYSLFARKLKWAGVTYKFDHKGIVKSCS